MTEATSKTKIRVVLPSYNEARRIEGSVNLISEWEQRIDTTLDFEWLWVNDGSSDDTEIQLLNHSKRLKNSRVLSYSPNKGKGFACQTGILDRQTDPDFIFFTDADLAIPLDHLLDAVKIFQEPTGKKVDVVLGDRNPENRSIHEHRHRNLMSMIFRNWVKFRLDLPFSDTQCGFKGFRAPVARQLFKDLRRPKFTFDVEILIRAHLHEFKVIGMPVKCFNDGPSSVRIFRDSLTMLANIERLRLEKRRLGPTHF